MDAVVDAGCDQLWTGVSREALNRTTSLALRALRADCAALFDTVASRPKTLSAAGAASWFAIAAADLCDAVIAAGAPADGEIGDDAGRRLSLAVPVTISGRGMIGVLCALWHEPPGRDPADLEALRAFAAALGEMVEGTRRSDDIDRREHPPMLAILDRPSFDAAAEAAAPDEPVSSVADARSGEARILLADDLDLNRKLIADMLAIDGYVVDCVADGAAAVKAAAERPYSLVLMDMIMPEMDGPAAARAIRALPAPACHVPIVALTANSADDQLDACLKAGMNATLTKPMTFDGLSAAVAAWLRPRSEAA